MKSNYCNCCNYTTSRVYDFNKHLSSKRHRKNAEKSITHSTDSITHSTDLVTNSNKLVINKYTCKHCNLCYKRIDNYNKHLTKCSIHLLEQNNKLKEEKEESENKLKAEKEELINFKVQLQQDKLKYIQKNKELELENELLKEKLYKSEHEVKDTEIKYLKKTGNTTNSHNNITQYITNKYPDAPNLQPIEKLDNYEKYATSSDDNKAKQNKSITKLIDDNYCSGVSPKNRSIWCIDTSRDKYIIKVDNKWETDLHGKEFCKHVMIPLGQQYLNYASQIIDSKSAGFASRAIALQYFYLYITGMTKLPRTVHPLLAVKRKEKEEVVE